MKYSLLVNMCCKFMEKKIQKLFFFKVLVSIYFMALPPHACQISKCLSSAVSPIACKFSFFPVITRVLGYFTYCLCLVLHNFLIASTSFSYLSAQSLNIILSLSLSHFCALFPCTPY